MNNLPLSCHELAPLSVLIIIYAVDECLVSFHTFDYSYSHKAVMKYRSSTVASGGIMTRVLRNSMVVYSSLWAEFMGNWRDVQI